MRIRAAAQPNATVVSRRSWKIIVDCHKWKEIYFSFEKMGEMFLWWDELQIKLLPETTICASERLVSDVKLFAIRCTSDTQ